MTVLIDTCVWSLALRRSKKHISVHEERILALLAEIISEGRARLLGLVLQELLSGIRHAEQFERILEAARAFPDIPVHRSEYELAAKAYNACRNAGVSGSPVDFLLCAIAHSRDWAILTSDKDFARYQRHVPFTLIPDTHS